MQTLDFLRLSDRSAAAIERLLGRASELREEFEKRGRSDWCAGRRVAFIWDGEGFRNRAAFELCVRSAGSVGVEIPGRLGAREAVADLAGYFDNWFDAIVVRTPSFPALEALAEHAEAPVVTRARATTIPARSSATSPSCGTCAACWVR
jgi:ornithine carbamoyltransferase